MDLRDLRSRERARKVEGKEQNEERG